MLVVNADVQISEQCAIQLHAVRLRVHLLNGCDLLDTHQLL